MIKEKKIPTILGLGILVLSIAASVFLVQTRKNTGTEAAVNLAPQQIRITNISDKSFTVSWVTDVPTTGFVTWGKSSSLGQTTDTDTSSKVHHITLESLSPQTTYYFKIGSGKTIFANNGQPYQTKTAPILSITPQNDMVFGDIKSTNKAPSHSIVYITVSGVSPLSTITDKNGNWSISLSTARNTNLTSYGSYNQNSNIDILVEEGRTALATSRILVGSARPVPTITIGENKDLTYLKPTTGGDLPKAQVIVPATQSEEQSSRFNLATLAPKATIKPTQTSKPTISPSPSPVGAGGPLTASPTPTAKPSPTATPAATLPSSGNLTVSLGMFIMGITLFLGGIILPNFKTIPA